MGALPVRHRNCAKLGSNLMVNTMDISGLSDSGMIAMAQTLNASKVQEKVGAAVLKMANDQAKQKICP